MVSVHLTQMAGQAIWVRTGGDGFQGNWGFDYQTVVQLILVSQTKIKYITKIKSTKEIYKLKWDAQKLKSHYLPV